MKPVLPGSDCDGNLAVGEAARKPDAEACAFAVELVRRVALRVAVVHPRHLLRAVVPKLSAAAHRVAAVHGLPLAAAVRLVLAMTMAHHGIASRLTAKPDTLRRAVWRAARELARRCPAVNAWQRWRLPAGPLPSRDRLLLAFHDREGGGVFFVSTRDTALLLGVTRQAAGKLLRRMLADGLLHEAAPASRTTARRFRLTHRAEARIRQLSGSPARTPTLETTTPPTLATSTSPTLATSPIIAAAPTPATKPASGAGRGKDFPPFTDAEAATVAQLTSRKPEAGCAACDGQAFHFAGGRWFCSTCHPP